MKIRSKNGVLAASMALLLAGPATAQSEPSVIFLKCTATTADGYNVGGYYRIEPAKQYGIKWDDNTGSWGVPVCSNDKQDPVPGMAVATFTCSISPYQIRGAFFDDSRRAGELVIDRRSGAISWHQTYGGETVSSGAGQCEPGQPPAPSATKF